MDIKQTLLKLWEKEYPDQGLGLIRAYDWEEALVPIGLLSAGPPRDLKKAKRYLKLMQTKAVEFPPIVSLNGIVVDGLHRYWAMCRAGFIMVQIYHNVPLHKEQPSIVISNIR